MSLNTESPKKIMYPTIASTSSAKSPSKAHHQMPKTSNSSLPKSTHANQILPNNHSHVNPHQYYSLRWNNYQNNLTDMFHELLNTEKFVDVTLACEHNYLKCHKVVLSACSSYFQKILIENPCKHPVIIMPPEIAFADLQFIIEFVYRGEIDVSEAELQSLIRTAEQLKIKGLCEINEHTATNTESDTEVIYPPHKKIRASRHHHHHQYDSGHRNHNNSQDLQKDAQPIASQEIEKRKSKSPIKEIGKSLSPATSNQNQSKNMASLEMGMNGNVVIPLAYMDFAPEPPAPTATPVITTEVNCTPSQDTKDLSIDAAPTNGTENARIIKFETLRSLDPTDTIVEFDNSIQHSICRLDHHSSTAHHPTVSTNSPIIHHTTHHASSTPVQIITTCSSPITSISDLSGLKTTSIITTVPSIMNPPTSQANDHHQHQQQQQQQQIEQSHSPDQQQQQQQQHHHQQQHQTIPHIHTLHHPQTITIHQAPPRIIQHHQIIETIKTEEVDRDIKPSIHELMSVGGGNGNAMEIDGQQTNNNENVHGIVVTPEIANMMASTPTSQIDHLNHLNHHLQHSDTSEDSKMHSEHNGSNGSIGHHLQYITLGNNIVATSTAGNTPTSDSKSNNSGPKTWTPSDMESALEALRSHNMSLTKASATYGIPSTTLWQRAHRLGIDTPKKEGPTKTWNEDSLNNALDALRTGTISANKASKAFGIPSSTLYKIARREGIRLAAPFNAAPTSWSAEDLEKALEAIRAGAASVQKASSEFGIPTGTLYGRCKREGIELSRSNPTPWSEDAMMEALEAVRVGQMSINQAAIHYNLPYSSLYGRFKRGKYGDPPNGTSHNDSSSHNTIEHSPENSISNYTHHTLIAETNVPQLQEQIIYQQHYSPSTQLIHQQPPQIYHHQQIIYHQSPPPHPQILQIHQIKKETS
ncbi:hypothetical protein PVAND_001868 [Polypedilum vanderplanki]|uniref:Uncharacterized protein n=1 Tax=Polypedilum vanderplanki TaxID=319348 RepID=A0A9J6BQI0_POLVA|nr:hypothetical protein PVAND_001868 [Polypedilum vanderplanki]